MFYYYKKDKIQKGELFCVYQSMTKLTSEEVQEINNNQNNLLENTIVYENDTPFNGYPVIDGDTIRKATDYELVNLGLRELKDGEYIEDNTLKKSEAPSWQYRWDKVTNQWIVDESKLQDGDYVEGNTIKRIEYNKELGYVKPIWNRELKQWLDGATDLEKVQAQINEYSELDTPSTLKEMGTELANECMDMLIQLRNIAYTLGNPIEDRDLLVLPKPSEKLKQFKNKYNSIR